jgi:hypothetical protein
VGSHVCLHALIPSLCFLLKRRVDGIGCAPQPQRNTFGHKLAQLLSDLSSFLLLSLGLLLAGLQGFLLRSQSFYLFFQDSNLGFTINRSRDLGSLHRVGDEISQRAQDNCSRYPLLPVEPEGVENTDSKDDRCEDWKNKPFDP